MLVVVAVAAAVLQVSLAAADLPVYKTPGLPVDQRVADLLSRMELVSTTNVPHQPICPWILLRSSAKNNTVGPIAHFLSRKDDPSYTEQRSCSYRAQLLLYHQEQHSCTQFLLSHRETPSCCWTVIS